jgi:hypothetical protein
VAKAWFLVSANRQLKLTEIDIVRLTNTSFTLLQRETSCSAFAMPGKQVPSGFYALTKSPKPILPTPDA